MVERLKRWLPVDYIDNGKPDNIKHFHEKTLAFGTLQPPQKQVDQLCCTKPQTLLKSATLRYQNYI